MDSIREKLPHDGEEEPCGRVKLHKAAVSFCLAAKGVLMHVDTRCVSKEAFATLRMPTFEKMARVDDALQRLKLCAVPCCGPSCV